MGASISSGSGCTLTRAEETLDHRAASGEFVAGACFVTKYVCSAEWKFEPAVR